MNPYSRSAEREYRIDFFDGQPGRAAATLPADAPIKPLASVADVPNLLEATANEVRRWQLETRLAICVGYLCPSRYRRWRNTHHRDQPVSCNS
jgi:hypothetical protein